MKKMGIYAGIMGLLLTGFVAANPYTAEDLPKIQLKAIKNETDHDLIFQKEGIDIKIPKGKTKKIMADREVVMTKDGQVLKNAQPLLIYRADATGPQDPAKNYIKVTFTKDQENKQWALIADLQLCKADSCKKDFSKKARFKANYKPFDKEAKIDQFEFGITIKGNNLEKSEIKKEKQKIVKRETTETHWFEHGKRSPEDEHMRRFQAGLEKTPFYQAPPGERRRPQPELFQVEPAIDIVVDDEIYMLLGKLPGATAEEVLGVPKGASEGRIKATFNKLRLKWHPDKATQRGVPEDQANEAFNLIEAAYKQLIGK